MTEGDAAGAVSPSCVRGRPACIIFWPCHSTAWAPLLLALAACGKAADRGNPACGLAALAGPTALLTQFSVPRQTLSARPRSCPSGSSHGSSRDRRCPAIVGRADSQLVVGVEGVVPPAIKPGYGVLVLDTTEAPRGIMLFEGVPVEGAPPSGP